MSGGKSLSPPSSMGSFFLPTSSHSSLELSEDSGILDSQESDHTLWGYLGWSMRRQWQSLLPVPFSTWLGPASLIFGQDPLDFIWAYEGINVPPFWLPEQAGLLGCSVTCLPLEPGYSSPGCSLWRQDEEWIQSISGKGGAPIRCQVFLQKNLPPSGPIRKTPRVLGQLKGVK